MENSAPSTQTRPRTPTRDTNTTTDVIRNGPPCIYAERRERMALYREERKKERERQEESAEQGSEARIGAPTMHGVARRLDALFEDAWGAQECTMNEEQLQLRECTIDIVSCPGLSRSLSLHHCSSFSDSDTIQK